MDRSTPTFNGRSRVECEANSTSGMPRQRPRSFIIDTIPHGTVHVLSMVSFSSSTCVEIHRARASTLPVDVLRSQRSSSGVVFRGQFNSITIDLVAQTYIYTDLLYGAVPSFVLL